jgi:hypothetical protein
MARERTNKQLNSHVHVVPEPRIKPTTAVRGEHVTTMPPTPPKVETFMLMIKFKNNKGTVISHLKYN